MQYKKIADEGGLATYAVIMDDGDEAVSELSRFACETGVNGASLSGVGGASSAVLGWFDFGPREYRRNAIDEQVEVVSVLGDIATTEDGKRRDRTRRSSLRDARSSDARDRRNGNADASA